VALYKTEAPCLSRYFVAYGSLVTSGDAPHYPAVIPAEDAAQKKLLRSLEEISTRDEKTHLHVVEKHEVPDFFLETNPAPS